MNKFSILYLFVLVYLCWGCRHNAHTILSEADKLMDVYPDSTLSLLSEIDFPQQLKGKEKADYWRIKSGAHRRLMTAMTTDSLILSSLDYYISVQDTDLILQSLGLVGRYYKWKKMPDSAAFYFSKGVGLSELIKDTVRIEAMLQEIVRVKLDYREMEDALKYTRKRIELNNSHLSHYILGIYTDGDSVDYHIRKAIELALLAKDSLSAAHYLRNYAGILYKCKEYNKAIEAIRETGQLSNHYKDFGPNHLIMASIYLSQNKLDSAKMYLKKAYQEKRKNSYGGVSDISRITNENHLAILQAVLDTKEGKDFDTSVMIYNDSIIKSMLDNNAILNEQLIERNALEQQNLKLALHQQRTRNLLFIGGLIIILISIFIYIYSKKRQQKLEETEERMETLQRLLRHAEEVKDEKENNTYFFRKTLLQQLGIIRLIATPMKRNKDLLTQLIDISQESVSTEALLNWNDLYPIINSVYDNFYTRLLIRYKNILNEKEIQLCCLLCADFSTSEISTIMQQSMQTIYQRKSSVRKKTGMDEKEDIVTFLREQI